MFPNIRRGSSSFISLTSTCADSGCCCPCPYCGGVSCPCGSEGASVPCYDGLRVLHGERVLIGGMELRKMSRR